MLEQVITVFENLGFSKIPQQVDFILSEQILFALWETLYATFLGTLFAYIIGLPLGIILVTGEKGGIRPLPPFILKIINTVCNFLRSVPFLILMVLCFPISRLILGTSIGTNACIVALTIAAAPFIARLTEASIRELDRGVIEAAKAFGATPFQIVMRVIIPETLPSLINGLTTATITILSYSAMAGSIGGGGLGALALLRGHGRQEALVLYVSVIFLVILVQIIQTLGIRIATKIDKRIANK